MPDESEAKARWSKNDQAAVEPPAQCDVMITCAQQHGDSSALAEALWCALEGRGLKVWLDLKMVRPLFSDADEGTAVTIENGNIWVGGLLQPVQWRTAEHADGKAEISSVDARYLGHRKSPPPWHCRCSLFDLDHAPAVVAGAGSM